MRKRLLALIAACAIVTPAVANEPWWCCDMCFNVSAGAEAIYWKPCTSAFAYGTTSTPTNSVTANKLLTVNPEYDWGFRIFGTIADECDLNGITLSWTYLRTSTSATSPRRTANNNLTIFVFAAGNAAAEQIKAKERYHYHNVQLRGTHVFCQKGDNRFYVYGGGRYVYIKNERKSENTFEDAAASPNIPISRNRIQSQFSGGGIEVGLGGEVGLGCGFGLVMRGGVAGLVGERKLRVRSTQNLAPENRIFPDSRTICLPGLDARVGFKYGSDCWCVNFDVEIGYQVEHYFNALAQPVDQGIPTNTSLFIDNVGFAGPYIGVTLSY